MVAITPWHRMVAYGVLDNMMPCLLVRCNNGIVVWVRLKTSARGAVWQCTRDNFSIVAPDTAAHIEQTLSAIATHSVVLAGAIVQVAYLEM